MANTPIFYIITIFSRHWNKMQGDETARQMMIPYMVMRHSGLFLQIVFFGALLSAIMSTASGAILAPATVIGENIVKPLKPDLTDKQLLYVMRISVIFITIMSVIFASMNKSIYELARQSSEISLVSLFTPLVFGLYWKRATAWGALASMFIGMAVWLIFTIFGSEYPAIIHGLTASILGMIVFSIIENKKPISIN